MFGIGFWETIAIIIIIIIVVKPEDIPKFVYRVGKFLGEIKRSYDILIDTLKELEQQVKEPADAVIMDEDIFSSTKSYKKKSVKRQKRKTGKILNRKKSTNIKKK